MREHENNTQGMCNNCGITVNQQISQPECTADSYEPPVVEHPHVYGGNAPAFTCNHCKRTMEQIRSAGESPAGFCEQVKLYWEKRRVQNPS